MLTFLPGYLLSSCNPFVLLSKEPAATLWLHKNEPGAPIFSLICYQKEKGGKKEKEKKISYYPQI